MAQVYEHPCIPARKPDARGEPKGTVVDDPLYGNIALWINTTLAKDVQAQIKSGDPIALVYLFGSRADEAAFDRLGPMSDYDFALLIDRDDDSKQLKADFAHAMATLLETEAIDVVLLSYAPIELAYAIIAQGKVLYERDTAARVEYEAYVMGRYGDYLPVLRAQRQEILEGADYGKRVQRYREALGRTRRTLGKIAPNPD